jgi:hypothetical protein
MASFSAAVSQPLFRGITPKFIFAYRGTPTFEKFIVQKKLITRIFSVATFLATLWQFGTIAGRRKNITKSQLTERKERQQVVLGDYSSIANWQTIFRRLEFFSCLKNFIHLFHDFSRNPCRYSANIWFERTAV